MRIDEGGRPVVGVGAVVWDRGRVLLIRRGKPPRAGEWSLPGGGQELGETVFEAARREVLEETGLIVRVLGLIDVVDFIARDEKGAISHHYTLVDVAAEAVEGTARAASDALEVAWVAPEDLDGFRLWSETRRIIDASVRLLPSESIPRPEGRG